MQGLPPEMSGLERPDMQTRLAMNSLSPLSLPIFPSLWQENGRWHRAPPARGHARIALLVCTHMHARSRTNGHI